MLLSVDFGNKVDDLGELPVVIPVEQVKTTVDLLRERHQRYGLVSFPFS